MPARQFRLRLRFSWLSWLPLWVVPIQLALGLTTVIMAVSQIVPLREFYEGVDWPVVVLLGAMIPLGGALESTGTTELLVAGLLVLVGELSPVLILAAILILTMTISDVLNNAATAILMAPIAFNIANGLDYTLMLSLWQLQWCFAPSSRRWGIRTMR